jgi:glycerol-3-phosphate responsive antiterminator
MSLNFHVAYLIMCHKNSEQVTRLISKLKSKNSTCFVHVDKEAGFDLSVIVNGGGY